jgi:hypothetical protein
MSVEVPTQEDMSVTMRARSDFFDAAIWGGLKAADRF